MQEHHSRESYFVVGEGLLGDASPRPGVAAAMSMEDEVLAFRFSRMGPQGRALGEPGRRKLGAAMTIDADQASHASKIPAGFTYLGQFLDHDLTFDKSRLEDIATVPVATLLQGRSPSLDLDSLYGLGPARTPEFYAADKVHLKTGATVKADFPTDGIADKPHAGFDLPRRTNRTARIPDVRNDENLAVGQTHNAFIRFHNRVADTLAADGVPQAQLFDTARETVVKHYQWMIRSDFLPRVVKPQLVDDVFTNGRKVFETAPVPGDPPTMPVEFSVGAYRLGHSMVRSAYDWNHVFDDGGGSLGLLFAFSGTGGDLGGNPRLPSNWIADFRRLYDFREAGRNDLRPIVKGRNTLNFARRIDTLLTDFLAFLPDGWRPRPQGLPPQPGVPQPDARAHAEAGHRPADGEPDAQPGRHADGPHGGAGPRRQQGRLAGEAQRAPARRRGEGHPPVVLRAARGRVQRGPPGGGRRPHRGRDLPPRDRGQPDLDHGRPRLAPHPRPGRPDLPDGRSASVRVRGQGRAAEPPGQRMTRGGPCRRCP